MSKKPLKDRWIVKTLAGKNLAGQVLNGVIDALPIPNFLNIIRGVLKNANPGDYAELVAETARHIDKTRLAVSVAVLVGLLYYAGILSAEDIRYIFLTIFSMFTGTQQTGEVTG